MRRVTILAAILALCAAVIGSLAAVGWVVAVAQTAPNISELPPREPHPPTQIFASDGTLLGYVSSKTVFSFLSGNMLPERLKEATVAIEDRRFWQHGALDYQGIVRAGIKDVFSGGGSIQGASTLTMQLVDNVYIPPRLKPSSTVRSSLLAAGNLKYKITQAKLAVQLAKDHSKRWILDSYLNDVPYGNVSGEEAIGVGAAAETFFGRPVWKLDLAQMALLAGLPQAPSAYNPFVHPDLARQRRQEVLQAMVNSHYISQAFADAVDKQGLQVHRNTKYLSHQEPFVFDYVLQQLAYKFCPKHPNPLTCTPVHDGGLKVYTTINLQDQQVARQAIVSRYGGTIINAQPGAALASVDPSNGHVLALAESAPYGTARHTQTTFDWPVAAHRQSGSAFKVFALMTLIHDYNGDPNQTIYTSRPLAAGWLPTVPSWEVHTAEHTAGGTMTLTKATIVSDNTVFAQLSADLNDQFTTGGWDKLDTIAHNMGIGADTLHGNGSEVLGGLSPGVTPLEMAVGSATIANGGWHIPPTILDHIVFPDGRTVNYGNPPRNKVFTDGETAAAIAVLKGVITGGTGSPYTSYGCPAAGKTGTANDEANAWFVGFTPKLSTAVWVGYPQGNISLAGLSTGGFGGPTAGPIWHDFMAKASRGYCGDWAPPTTAWSGVPFVGQHSGAKSVPSTTNTTTSGKPGNQHNNPTLYQGTPQPPSTSGGTGLSGGSGGNKH
ncbi:MAG: penicillin-binding protein [Actinomycetota bacterium]|nr:penicillin-binding protein [Actinomycetota bacterium]